MNDYRLDSTSGNNLSPRKLQQEVSAKKNPKNKLLQNESFKKILKGAVEKSAGSPEIRQDLVTKYKVSLADGTYEVKAQELAEKMIQKIRENKTRNIT